MMPVAGVCLVASNRRGLSSRIYDLWLVSFQLVDRSGQSAMGAVIVNSGILAFYRTAVVRDNLDGYLNEAFFGRPVTFSDDSMLTPADLFHTLSFPLLIHPAGSFQAGRERVRAGMRRHTPGRGQGRCRRVGAGAELVPLARLVRRGGA
ncbi:hypothetical protein [Nonomuraea sp. NPDC050310]|uniref:hypothetical protein n=1 Tax=Nonomuraea sp. NPDC050310 TaxID=3154935 RepID=UPI0033E00E18